MSLSIIKSLQFSQDFFFQCSLWFHVLLILNSITVISCFPSFLPTLPILPSILLKTEDFYLFFAYSISSKSKHHSVTSFTWVLLFLWEWTYELSTFLTTLAATYWFMLRILRSASVYIYLCKQGFILLLFLLYQVLLPGEKSISLNHRKNYGLQFTISNMKLMSSSKVLNISRILFHSGLFLISCNCIFLSIL